MNHADYCVTIIGQTEEIDFINKYLGGIATCENLRALTGTREGYEWFCNVPEDDERVEYSLSPLTGGKSEITIWMDSFEPESRHDDMVRLTQKFPTITIYCSTYDHDDEIGFYTAVYECEQLTSEWYFDWNWLRIIPNLIVMQRNDPASANQIAMREFGAWTNRFGYLDIDDSHMLGLVTCSDLNEERGEVRDILSWARILSAFPEREWQKLLKVYPDELRALSKNVGAILKFTKNLDDLVETLDEEELDEFEEIGWELTEETISFCKYFLKRLKSKQVRASLAC